MNGLNYLKSSPFSKGSSTNSSVDIISLFYCTTA